MFRSAPTPRAWTLLALAGGIAAAHANTSIDTSTGDPLRGQAIYTNAAVATGIADLPSCSDCHGAVQSRRYRIGGEPYADLSRDQAMDAIAEAIYTRAPMSVFQRLTPAQGADLAAYIADVPRPSTSTLALTATAADTPVAESLDFGNGVSADGGLTVTSVVLMGDDGAHYRLDSDACTAQTLAPGATCRVTVGFQAEAALDGQTVDAVLRYTLLPEGDGESFTRDVALAGQVALVEPTPTPTPTPTAPGPSASAPDSDTGDTGDTGGGALGAGGLLGLALAAAWTGRARRAARRATR